MYSLLQVLDENWKGHDSLDHFWRHINCTGFRLSLKTVPAWKQTRASQVKVIAHMLAPKSAKPLNTTDLRLTWEPGITFLSCSLFGSYIIIFYPILPALCYNNTWKFGKCHTLWLCERWRWKAVGEQDGYMSSHVNLSFGMSRVAGAMPSLPGGGLQVKRLYFLWPI